MPFLPPISRDLPDQARRSLEQWRLQLRRAPAVFQGTTEPNGSVNGNFGDIYIKTDELVGARVFMKSFNTLPAFGWVLVSTTSAVSPLFAGGLSFDFAYLGDDASATSWTSATGPTLSASLAQDIDGSTAGLNSGALGDLTNQAARTVLDPTFAGWASDGVSKATLSSGTFTLRVLGSFTDQASGESVVIWRNFIGGGDDFFVQIAHTSGAFMQLVVAGTGGQSTFNLTGITFGTFTLLDIVHTPGVGVTYRYNGTETTLADTTTRDPTTNGTGGDIGIGNNGVETSARCEDQTIVGWGMAPGDIGLARHNADAQALGLI